MMNQEELIAEYKDYHDRHKWFCKGSAILKHIPEIARLANMFECKTALDYGCGKAWFWKLEHWRGILNNAIKKVTLYDPGVEEYKDLPTDTRFDLVICTDVLEHVHPDETIPTIQKLFLYTRRVLFLNISTVPATKTLSDGTNVHVNLRKKEEWAKIINDQKNWYADKYKTYPAVVVRYDEEINL